MKRSDKKEETKATESVIAPTEENVETVTKDAPKDPLSEGQESTEEMPPEANESETPADPADDQASEPEVTEATETVEPVEEHVIKQGGRNVKIRGFFGLYKDAMFIEDETRTFGSCHNVDAETLASLQSDYPGAVVEDI